jgi:hypothetical protein
VKPVGHQAVGLVRADPAEDPAEVQQTGTASSTTAAMPVHSANPRARGCDRPVRTAATRNSTAKTRQPVTAPQYGRYQAIGPNCSQGNDASLQPPGGSRSATSEQDRPESSWNRPYIAIITTAAATRSPVRTHSTPLANPSPRGLAPVPPMTPSIDRLATSYEPGARRQGRKR